MEAKDLFVWELRDTTDLFSTVLSSVIFNSTLRPSRPIMFPKPSGRYIAKPTDVVTINKTDMNA